MTEVKWVTVQVKPRGKPRRYSRFLNRRLIPTGACIDITPQSMKDELAEEHYQILLQHIQDTRND